MSDRQTTSFTVMVNGESKKVVAKSYLTARERMPLQQMLFGAMSGKALTAETKPEDAFENMDASVLLDYNQKLVEAMLVSFDDVTDNVNDFVLDSLPSHVYDDIVTKLNDLLNPKK